MMYHCGNKGCEYTTAKSERMQEHMRNTGHGKTEGGRKEFRGHLATARKKTSKKSK